MVWTRLKDSTLKKECRITTLTITTTIIAPFIQRISLKNPVALLSESMLLNLKNVRANPFSLSPYTVSMKELHLKLIPRTSKCDVVKNQTQPF